MEKAQRVAADEDGTRWGTPHAADRIATGQDEAATADAAQGGTTVRGGRAAVALRGQLPTLQRLVGNRVVAAALTSPTAPAGTRAGTRASSGAGGGEPANTEETPDPAVAATAGTGPHAGVDTSVIDQELAEVTSISGVSASKSPTGRNILVPESPLGDAPTGLGDAATGGAPQPVPDRATRSGLDGQPADHAPGDVSVRGGQEIANALNATTAPLGAASGADGAGTASAHLTAVPRNRPPGPTGGAGPTGAPGIAGGPATAVGIPTAGATAATTPATAIAGLVAPPAPDQLSGQIPATPSAEAVEEDLLDERSPEQKRAAAHTEIAGLRAMADQRRGGVAAEVGGHRSSVLAQGQARRAEVGRHLQTALADLTQRATASRTELTAAATARKTEIRAQVDTDAATARETTTAKVSEATQAMTAKRQSLTQAAQTEQARALTAADAEATRAAGELEAAAVDCEQAGERQAARYPGQEEPRPEQRAAARQVARESAADIRSKKAGIGPDLRAKATEHGQQCTGYAGQVVTQLVDAERVLVEQLHTTGGQAETAIRDGLTGALAAVDNRLAADLAAVDAAAAATRTQITSAAATTTGAINADVTTALGELSAGGQAIDREIDNTATETTTVLTQPEHPFLPGVLEQVAAARGQITATAQGGSGHLTAAAGGADRRFAATASAFAAGTATATGQFGSQLGQITSGFTAATDRAAAARTEAAAGIVTQLREQQQQLTDGVLAEAERACQDARAELSRMGTEHGRVVTDAANRAVEEGIRPKTDDIHTRTAAAAEQVDEGFWAGLGRAVVQIAIGLVVLVVVALVVAAIAAAFGVLLTAWTAIMIAGAILLAASLILALVHRLGQRELAGRPGTAILVALADTVGITGIYEGVGGYDIVTGAEITSVADRTERGILGAVTLVTLVLGVRSAIKGPPGGAFVRPVGSVPGWASLGPLGRALAGARGVAGEIASAIAGGVRSVSEWLSGRRSPGGTEPGGTEPGGTEPGGGGRRPPPQPGELPPEDIDPTVVRHGELTFQDRPGYVPEGVTAPEGATPATVEVTLPDGRFGWASRAYDPATGQFHSMQINLSDIPPELRVVETAPGQRVPLSDYLTIRTMRLLNVMIGRLRNIRVHEVENVRTVLQIHRGDPVANTQTVTTHVDAVVRAGGRVTGARVVEGTGQRMTLARLLAIWEGDTPPPDMVARHDAILRDFGLTREQAATTEVLSGFDIVIDLAPAGGAAPVPVVPAPSGGDQDAGP